MFNNARRYRVTMLASLLFLLSLALCVSSQSEGAMIGEIVVNASSGIDLLTGYTAQLYPLAVPDKSFDALDVMGDAAITNPQFVFYSSDPSVAMVDSTGTITGVGDGSATINISDTTGRLRSAQCLVTVQDRDPIYTAVLFAASNYEVPVNSIDSAFIESAKSFEEFLNKTQYAGRIFPVYDFTRADVEAWFDEMERWNDELHLTDYDATLIYIATHGMGDPQGNGLGFITIEANEYITYQELKNGLDRVNGVVTVIADSCFSGGLIAEEHFELGDYLRRIFSAGSEWHNETFTTSGPMLEGKYKVLTATSYDETGLAWPNGLMYTSYIFLWDFSIPTAPTPSWQSLYGTNEYVTLNDVYQFTVSNTQRFVQWVHSYENNENFTYDIRTQVWPENSNYPLFYFPQNETVTISDDPTEGNAGAGNRLTGNVLVKHGEYSYYIIEDESNAYVCRTNETSMQEYVLTPPLGSIRSNSLLINGNRMYLQEQYGDYNLFSVDMDSGTIAGQYYERITSAYDVYDGYIYFSESVTDAETLSRIPMTGGDKEILCRFEECGEIPFVIHNNRIYMNPSGTPSGIYTMNLDGSDLRELWAGPYDIIRDMQLSDGYIYYYASNPKDLPGNYLYEMDISICRIPIDGESYPETLFTVVSDFFTMNVCGDKIYYTARTQGEDGGSEDSLYWFDMNSRKNEFLWRPEGEFHFPGYSVYGSDVYVKIEGNMYRYNAESKTLYTFPGGTEISGTELYPSDAEGDEPEVFTDGDYQYRVEDGKAIITDYTGEETIIEIPETLGGYSVTAIDEYGFGWTDIKMVTLCDSMTELC